MGIFAGWLQAFTCGLDIPLSASSRWSTQSSHHSQQGRGGQSSLDRLPHPSREVIPEQMHFLVRMWMGPGSSCSLSECAGRGIFWVRRCDRIMHLSTNDIEYVHVTSIVPLLVPTVLGREHSLDIWVEALRRSFHEYHRLGVGNGPGQPGSMRHHGLENGRWKKMWLQQARVPALATCSIVSLDFCYGAQIQAT